MQLAVALISNKTCGGINVAHSETTATRRLRPELQATRKAMGRMGRGRKKERERERDRGGSGPEREQIRRQGCRARRVERDTGRETGRAEGDKRVAWRMGMEKERERE